MKHNKSSIPYIAFLALVLIGTIFINQKTKTTQAVVVSIPNSEVQSNATTKALADVKHP